jgi:hypothetical protein
MAPPPIALEIDLSIRSGVEMAHPRKIRGLSGAQLLENVVYDAIQAVRCLAGRHAGLSGQLFSDLLFPHPLVHSLANNLAAAQRQTGPSAVSANNKPLTSNGLVNQNIFHVVVNGT